MKSRVFVQKLDHYDLEKIESFVRSAVDLFDPESQRLGRGQKVLLKPNLLRAAEPERCVTTHPALIEAVCRVLRDRGAGKIDISDSPAFGSPAHVAQTAGYGPLMKRYDVRVVPFRDPVSFAGEENIPHLKIAGNLKEYDQVINLPKVKSHCQMTLTLGIKNLFGVVIGKRKPVLHCLVQNDKVKFGRMLVDIAREVAPCLTLADGILAMEGDGPIRGTPYPLGILAAAQDITALDRVIVEITGVRPETVYALEAARQKRFGASTLDEIEMIGETGLAALRVSDFRLAQVPLDISFNPFRLVRSVLKQIYQVGIKEKLAG